MTAISKIDGPFEEIYIPGELERRVAPEADYLQEKIALQELAARMVDAPGEVLAKFVDLAMDLGGGISAGLSLYEEEAGTAGVFRWHHLCGVLSPFEGATTPRDFSPCGITLDRRAPVLATHAERMYEWISKANIVVPEVLLVPLYIGSIEPLGTLWIVSDTVGHFHPGHARVMTELATFVGIALRLQRDERDLKNALAEQETLTREMSHRVQNLFSMVQSIVLYTGKRVVSAKEMAQIVSGRIQALARANALAGRGSGSATHTAQRTADLGSLVAAITMPYEDANGQSTRFSINGSAITCSERAVQGLALLLHELTTNSVKYGALSADTGRIDIGWKVRLGKLVLNWNETGGPEILEAPQREGFGTTLSRLMINQLRGQLTQDWQRQGLRVIIEVPESSLAM